MKKHEMVALLRSAGVDENAVTLAINAWEMGAEWERNACAKVAAEWADAYPHPSKIIHDTIIFRGTKNEFSSDIHS
jgi:hypothetical protein